MGIFKRINDIISANLNEMVEQHEDPEKMLKQAVREMEESIKTAKRDVAKAMANEKLTAKELETNERQAVAWGERARAAVEAGDDDNARKALARKREYEKVAAALKDQHDALLTTSTTLRHQLEAMQAKLSEASRQLGTLTARKKAADVRSKMAQVEQGLDLDQDAFDKFERLSRKVEQAEAEAEAMAELAGSDPRAPRISSPAEDLSQADAEVEAELAAMKRKRPAKS